MIKLLVIIFVSLGLSSAIFLYSLPSGHDSMTPIINSTSSYSIAISMDSISKTFAEIAGGILSLLAIITWFSERKGHKEKSTIPWVVIKSKRAIKS
jgi:hypothetical protein